MRKKKINLQRISATLCVAAMSASMLAGCADSSNGQTEQESASKVSEASSQTSDIPSETTSESGQASADVIDPATPLTVTGGQITGTASEDNAIAIYKGIPYAAPPVGDLRWKAPQDVESWDGVKECTEFGSSSVQGAESAFGNYSDEFLNSNRTYSEDSLTLNVWTPENNEEKDKPVIFYIHGGGYTSGGSSVPIYDGEEMARKGIVYVSINYRLGNFGFYGNTELLNESENDSAGNYAILDMIKALEWVQENIGQFGGDPDNVTIIGQSAGASAINTLTLSPLAEGLFKQAIGWSGLSLSNDETTLEDVLASGDEVQKSLDMTLEEMRDLTAEEVLELSGGLRTNIDDYVLTDTSLNTMVNGEENDVPTMTGMVLGDTSMNSVISSPFASYVGLSEDEYIQLVQDNFGDLADTMLSIYPANGDNSLGIANQLNTHAAMMRYQVYANVRSKTATTPTYLYVYEHPYAGLEDQGAFHSSDIPYWLGGVFTEDKTFSDFDYELADIMSGYVSNFAESGDVNGDELPEWEAYDTSKAGYMCFSDDEISFTEINPIIANAWNEYYGKQLGVDLGTLEVTEEDEEELALLQEQWKADANASADNIAGTTPDDPENPTLSVESAGGTKISVSEFAAGAFQPVSTGGDFYPIMCYAADTDGNKIGDIEVVNGEADYGEYADTASQIVVISSFSGKQLNWDIP
jgi:para-nitrobenzyl esterase